MTRNEWLQLACCIPVLAGFELTWIATLTQQHWLWYFGGMASMAVGVKGVMYFDKKSRP